MKALTKRFLSLFLLFARFDAEPSVHTRGIFWRERAIRTLLSEEAITTGIIERNFYSLYRAVAFDPQEIRKEYVENLRENLLALSVRGDANASQRFYEALSASRIPLFLDTDCVLPLEEIIDYSRVILRVPSKDIAHISKRVLTWHKTVAQDDLIKTEQEAREIYGQYLRMDRFFALVFDRERSPYKKLLFDVKT